MLKLLFDICCWLGLHQYGSWFGPKIRGYDEVYQRQCKHCGRYDYV